MRNLLTLATSFTVTYSGNIVIFFFLDKHGASLINGLIYEM